MAIETWRKISGVWRASTIIWRKISGNWREVKAIWRNVNGTWRKVYENTPPFTASLSGIFGSKFDVPRTSTQTSDTAVTVNISSGTLTASLSGSSTNLRMSINGGPYLLGSRTVSNGDVIKVRQTSSSSYNTTTTCTLNLDGYDSETFSVTTEFAP